MRNPILLTCAIAAVFVAGCASETQKKRECLGETEDAIKVCATGATLKGVDVSYHNGTVDWAKVKAAGQSFAFVRVSDGTKFYDSQFVRNYAETRKQGLARGVYQFFRPAQDPIAQADLLITKINQNGGLQPGDLPPVLDLEAGDGQTAAVIVARAKQWVAKVQAAFGVTPIVYTAAYFSNTYVGNAFSSHPLWVANYQTSCPTVPNGWANWHFWQNSESGTVAGVSGAVDTNLFQGDLAALKALTVKAPVLASPDVRQQLDIGGAERVDTQSEDGGRTLGQGDDKLVTSETVDTGATEESAPAPCL